MTLVKIKRQPFFNENFNSDLQNFYTPFSSLYRSGVTNAEKAFIPVNIKESDEKFTLQIVAPGLTKDTFKISLDKNILTISAEKKENGVGGEKTIRNEYSFSSFSRSFTLTKEIDVEGISAEYVNGVLVLNLPKKIDVKPPVKQILIN